MHQPHHKPGPGGKDRRMEHSITGNRFVATQLHARNSTHCALNKRKESRGGSDVLTFHARPQATCPAHTAPAPCRLQDRADATDAMVLLTPGRPTTCACPLTGVAVPATEDRRPTVRRRAGPPLHAELDWVQNPGTSERDIM